MRLRAVLPLLLAACASAPPPAPSAPDTSVVALRIRTRPERDVHAGRPGTVFFARVAEGTDAALQPEVIPSNYYADGVAYLLDAPPGRYVAVACAAKYQSREWTAYFAGSLVRATERDVPAGRAVLLGSYEAEIRSIATEGDEAQRHYMGVVAPRWQSRSELLKIFTRDEHAWATVWREFDDRAEVEARMRKTLGDAWAGRFR